MLVSDDEERIAKVRFWATQARDPARHYQHSELGFNYRMSNVAAGIGRGQLKVLDERVAKKKYIFGYYKRALGDLPGVHFMPENEWNEPNFWLSCLLLDESESEEAPASGPDPESIMVALEKENIEARPIWKPMHIQPYFEEFDFVTTASGGSAFDPHRKAVSEQIFERGLCLPSDTKMTDEELDRVCGIVKVTLQEFYRI